MLNDLLKKLAQGFVSHKITYMIIGGQAALLYREPRFTIDIDISIGLCPEDKGKILKLADDLNLEPLTDKPEEFIDETMVLPLIDRASNFRIDLIFSATQYENDALKRANTVYIDNIAINYCSLEDIIILKVFAGRQRDLDDVEAILRANSNYNSKLITDYLDKLGESVNMDFKGIFNRLQSLIKK